MNTAQYNHLFSFIWNIANDVLVHAFEKGEYKKIIMPMTVLRRLNLSIKPVLDDKGKEILPALDNHMMGTLFEELLRKFNEEQQARTMV